MKASDFVEALKTQRLKSHGPDLKCTTGLHRLPERMAKQVADIQSSYRSLWKPHVRLYTGHKLSKASFLCRSKPDFWQRLSSDLLQSKADKTVWESSEQNLKSRNQALKDAN
jgi:hypothetical protein